MNNEMGYVVVENGTTPLGICPIPLSAAFIALDRYNKRAATSATPVTFDVRPVYFGQPVLRRPEPESPTEQTIA